MDHLKPLIGLLTGENKKHKLNRDTMKVEQSLARLFFILISDLKNSRKKNDKCQQVLTTLIHSMVAVVLDVNSSGTLNP